MMKHVFVIMVALLVNAPLLLLADDVSTICTNDGKCYTLCSKHGTCEPEVDALCITYWGRQDLNEVSNSCVSDIVTQQCYLCYGPPTTE